jgi:hypothetical protein
MLEVYQGGRLDCRRFPALRSLRSPCRVRLVRDGLLRRGSCVVHSDRGVVYHRSVRRLRDGYMHRRDCKGLHIYIRDNFRVIDRNLYSVVGV